MEIQIGDRRQNLYRYGGFINIYDYNVNQFESADSIAEIYIQDGQVFFRNIQSKATFQTLRLLPSPSEKKLFYYIPLYETLYINDIKTTISPTNSSTSSDGLFNASKTGTTTIPNTPQKPSQPDLTSLTEPRVNKPFIFETKSESKLHPVWGKQKSTPSGQLSRIAPETTTLDLERVLFGQNIPESQSNEKDSKESPVSETSMPANVEEETRSKQNQATNQEEIGEFDEKKIYPAESNHSFEQAAAAPESDTTNEEENNIPSTPADMNISENIKSPEKVDQQPSVERIPSPEEQGGVLHDHQQQIDIGASVSETNSNKEETKNMENYPEYVAGDESNISPERTKDIVENQEEVHTSRQILQDTEENEKKDIEAQEQEREEEEIPLTNYTFPSSAGSTEEQKGSSQLQSEGINIVTSSFNLTKPMQAFARRKAIKVQDSVTDATNCIILGSPPLRRTHKFLLATSLGKPAISSKYILDSMKEGMLLNYDDYIYEDRQAEEKWNFSLKNVHRRHCLEGLKFYITSAMRSSMVGDSLQGLYSIIETSGANVVEDIQEAKNPPVVILGLPANDTEGYNMFSTGLRVYKMEIIALSILRDRIDFDEFAIDYSQNNVSSTGPSGRSRKRSSRTSFSKSRAKEQKT